MCAKRTNIVVLCAIITALLCGALSVSAATKKASYAYTRVFYYQNGPLSRQSLFDHPNSIDVLAPQTYAFDAEGNLTGFVEGKVLAFAAAHHIKVMPLVTNANFSPTAHQSLLDDPAMQDVAIKALIADAKTNGYWGWQIDFEQMDSSYRDRFTAFIKKTADAMRNNHLILSVAVIAQTSQNPSDYPNNLWQKTIGVYDYAELSQSADFISVMAYDDPFSKGPVVQYAWLKKVLAYSTKLIPNDKLSLGIPLYYWQWSDTTGKRIGIGGREGIANILKKHKVVFSYSAKHEAPYLTYWNRSKEYTVWYENTQSIKKKLALIKENNLHGFSAWALGLELASVHDIFRQ